MRRNISRESESPEAGVNNPVAIWFLVRDDLADDAEDVVIDLDYGLMIARRRYGAESESANQAWDIFEETVYKASLNGLGQVPSRCKCKNRILRSGGFYMGQRGDSYEKAILKKRQRFC